MSDIQDKSSLRENKTNVKHVEIEYAAPENKQNSKYQSLRQEFEDFKALCLAKDMGLFDSVKTKFKETVYDMIDCSKDIKGQLENIQKEYSEFFITESQRNDEKKSNDITSSKDLNVKTLLKIWGYNN